MSEHGQLSMIYDSPITVDALKVTGWVADTWEAFAEPAVIYRWAVDKKRDVRVVFKCDATAPFEVSVKWANCEPSTMQNVRTMNDLRELIRLFGGKP